MEVECIGNTQIIHMEETGIFQRTIGLWNVAGGLGHLVQWNLTLGWNHYCSFFIGLILRLHIVYSIWDEIIVIKKEVT